MKRVALYLALPFVALWCAIVWCFARHKHPAELPLDPDAPIPYRLAEPDPLECAPGEVVMCTPSHETLRGGLVTVRIGVDGKMRVVDPPELIGDVDVDPLDDRRAALELAINDVSQEIMSARLKFGAFHSAHEGFAVALEEVDELWEIVKVKQKDRDLDKMRREAIQAAAMFTAFAAECCGEKTGRV